MISIVIPTYNHLEDCLKPCIDSIKKYTDLSQVEVIVVANGCKDDTREYVQSLGDPFKLLWFDEGIGYTKATNEGIKSSTGEYIILLNNDTVLLPQNKNHWISALTAPFSDPKMAVTGPMLNFCQHAKRHFLVFFCAMIKRSVIDSIGLLDEIFSPGFGEDADFCARAVDRGYNIQQVPTDPLRFGEGKIMVGNFPIFHIGEATFDHDPMFSEIVKKNSAILRDRYAKVPPNNIYDCFMFSNELDVLEIRLNELKYIVHKHIIVESTSSQSGLPKPLHLKDNWERFKEFHDKIIHVVVEDMPEGKDPWERERHQRDAIMRGIPKDVSDNDLFIISDADEIPSAEVLKDFYCDDICSLQQYMCYYHVNCVSAEPWEWLKILPYRLMKDMSPCQVRYTHNTRKIPSGGWHFSFLGGANAIREKIKAYAHQEFNRSDILDNIEQRVANGDDVFNRGIKYTRTDLDSRYPKYIIDNQEKFRHLIRGL